MTGVAHNPVIQHKCLLVLVVLKAVIPGTGAGRRLSHLSHSQEIEEPGLFPDTGQ